MGSFLLMLLSMMPPAAFTSLTHSLYALSSVIVAPPTLGPVLEMAHPTLIDVGSWACAAAGTMQPNAKAARLDASGLANLRRIFFLPCRMIPILSPRPVGDHAKVGNICPRLC